MFVVEQYLKPAILAKIDENQFGAISNSSTVTDGNGSTNRIILFHFRKAYFLFSVFKCFTGRNVRFACLQIYCKSCYKFQICNDLPHLHACKLLICTHGKLGGKCGNGREAVRRKSVANPLQTNYFATSLHACKFNTNTKFASDLHIRKSVDYIKLANGL